MLIIQKHMDFYYLTKKKIKNKIAITFVNIKIKKKCARFFSNSLFIQPNLFMKTFTFVFFLFAELMAFYFALYCEKEK